MLLYIDIWILIRYIGIDDIGGNMCLLKGVLMIRHGCAGRREYGPFVHMTTSWIDIYIYPSQIYLTAD